MLREYAHGFRHEDVSKACLAFGGTAGGSSVSDRNPSPRLASGYYICYFGVDDMNYYATKSTTYVKKLILNQSHAVVHSVYRKTINVVTGDHLFAIQAKDSHLSPVSVITSMTGEEMSQLFLVPGMEVLITPKLMIFPTFVLSLEDTVYVDLRLKSFSEIKQQQISESESAIVSDSKGLRYSDFVFLLRKEIAGAIRHSCSGGLDVVFHSFLDTGDERLTSYQDTGDERLTSYQDTGNERLTSYQDTGDERLTSYQDVGDKRLTFLQDEENMKLVPCFDSGEAGWNIFQKAAAVRLQNAYDLFKKKSFSESAKELIHLIGLGTGLTPCGDDFICGVFAGFQLLNAIDHPFINALRPLVADHLSDTNIISSTFLKCSMEGQFSAAVNALAEINDVSINITSIDNKSPGVIKAEKIMGLFNEIGHSSGFDSLCGIYYAMILL